MAILLNTLAMERSTYVVTVSFADEDGAAVVPSSATWTLTDGGGAVVNSRQDVTLAPLAAAKQIVLSGNDLALASNQPEWRILTVTAAYISSLGADLPLNEEVRFLVAPLAGVA